MEGPGFGLDPSRPDLGSPGAQVQHVAFLCVPGSQWRLTNACCLPSHRELNFVLGQFLRGQGPSGFFTVHLGAPSARHAVGAQPSLWKD